MSLSPVLSNISGGWAQDPRTAKEFQLPPLHSTHPGQQLDINLVCNFHNDPLSQKLSYLRIKTGILWLNLFHAESSLGVNLRNIILIYAKNAKVTLMHVMPPLSQTGRARGEKLKSLKEIRKIKQQQLLIIA